MKKKKRYEKPRVVRMPVDMKQMVKNVTGGGGPGHEVQPPRLAD